MEDIMQTLLVCLLMTAVAIMVIEVIRLIQLFRIRNHREEVDSLKVMLARRSNEVERLYSQLTSAASREFCHNERISQLTKECEALEAENRMLMEKTPVIKPLREKRIKTELR